MAQSELALKKVPGKGKNNQGKHCQGRTPKRPFLGWGNTSWKTQNGCEFIGKVGTKP